LSNAGANPTYDRELQRQRYKKIHNTASSLAHFKNKNILICLENAPAYHDAVVVKSNIVKLATRVFQTKENI
jgi:hypothetical protein